MVEALTPSASVAVNIRTVSPGGKLLAMVVLEGPEKTGAFKLRFTLIVRYSVTLLLGQLMS